MDTAFAPLPIIRPITDMRTKLNDVCSQASETGEPVVLTKNGNAAFVLMSSDAYDAMKQHDRFHLALREAELEERWHPEALTAQESDAKMAELFCAMGVEYAPDPATGE